MNEGNKYRGYDLWLQNGHPGAHIINTWQGNAVKDVSKKKITAKKWQHIFVTYRMADMAVHGELLAAARDDARLIIERDPDLTGPRGAALRTLLYLFERDAAVRLLRSG